MAFFCADETELLNCLPTDQEIAIRDVENLENVCMKIKVSPTGNKTKKI